MTDMTSSFKAQTEKFVHDIQSDLKQQSKPILKHPSDKQPQDVDDTQAYREEKRMAQYGKKKNSSNIYSTLIINVSK